VVANAGVHYRASLVDCKQIQQAPLEINYILTWAFLATIEDVERVMGTNFMGVFLCKLLNVLPCTLSLLHPAYSHLGFQQAARQMIQQGRGGRIIGASSVAGKQASPLSGIYAASKFAVRGLTQSTGRLKSLPFFAAL
jgi:NAD(P)-dependent dehydrogenase (short-subunit alcohol dehydrogenase family)